MAIKRLTPDTVDASDDQLPLVNDYIKENKTALNKPFIVLTVSLSRSGQWLMLDTSDFRVMFNIKSAEAKSLIPFFKQISGHEADSLVAVPIKGKKGVTAMIGADDTERKEYLWTEDELIIANVGELGSSTASTTLTLEGFHAKPLSTGKSTKK